MPDAVLAKFQLKKMRRWARICVAPLFLLLPVFLLFSCCFMFVPHGFHNVARMEPVARGLLRVAGRSKDRGPLADRIASARR